MTSDSTESHCPGCGLTMPAGNAIPYDGYFNASAECWSVFTEVLGREFSEGASFGQLQHLTAEAYAVQHAGGQHPDKSVGLHLAGLFLMVERGIAPASVAPYMQKLAERVRDWRHLDAPPSDGWKQTIFDVAMADDHVAAVRKWSAEVWEAWSPQRDRVTALLEALD
ncbi:MAG TPA: DUF5946 family protein [Thermoanaerobaculia bacterium]|nr:DUF5946 family protein [Thermoanaerobaculia bacterium]